MTRSPAKILAAAASCAAVRAERESGPLVAPLLDRLLEGPGLRLAKLERRCDRGGHVPERRLTALGEKERARRRLRQGQPVQLGDVVDMHVGPDIQAPAHV